MELVNFMGLAVSAAISAGLGGTPSGGTGSRANVQAESTQVVLTVDALSRMTAFWAAFVKEPPSVRDIARMQTHKDVLLSVDLGGASVSQLTVQVVDMIAMAAKYPSVAADFKQAQVTPEQWEQLRLSLFTATVTDKILKAVTEKEKAQGSPGSIPAPSPLVGQNIAFLQTHQNELQALKATGMWFPNPQEIAVDDGSDLDP
jgi:hypothetical protein